MSYTTILVKEMCLAGHQDDIAAESITPGYLIAHNADSNLEAHKVLDGPAISMFAREDEGKTIDDVYPVSSTVYYKISRAGDEIYAFLKMGNVSSKGAYLNSAGDGMLKLSNSMPTTGYVLAIALEAVDATSTNKRILVQII